MKKEYVALSVIVLAVILAVGYFSTGDRKFGGAPPGLPVGLASTSLLAVSGTVVQGFATSTNCASRIITASTTNIHITFGEINNFQPSPTQGHLQLASTTVAYDSGIYGCNSWRIWSGGSQNLTVTETR